MMDGRWLILLLPAPLMGCAAPREPRARDPVRWIVVEKRPAELADEGLLVDRALEESSKLLALQPLYPEDLNWVVRVKAQDFYVELLELTPDATRAAPGERVTARVRVGNARGDSSYRLFARPSTAAVRILGDHEVVVRGASAASFSFTSLSPGSAGIAIAVEKTEEGEQWGAQVP